MPTPPCARCRVPLEAGHFTVTVTYRPRPGPPGPDEPADATVTLRLCRDCAQAMLRWVDEGLTAPRS